MATTTRSIQKQVQPIKTVKEIKAMRKQLRANEGTGLRDELLFFLGINVGLRMSDLLSLRIADIYSEGKPVDKYYITEKKTKKRRAIPIGKDLQAMIVDYITADRANAATDEYLFVSRRRNAEGAKVLSRVQAYRILNEAGIRAKVKTHIGTHTLRKTFAYTLYENGVDLARIQKLLNHSSQRETLDYIGIETQELDDIVLSLEQFYK
jgi:site-specific recombinase XerD